MVSGGSKPNMWGNMCYSLIMHWIFVTPTLNIYETKLSAVDRLEPADKSCDRIRSKYHKR